MIKKILLIDPPGFGAGLNLGLGYLAAVLEKSNYQVRVVDCNNSPTRLAKGPQFNWGFSKLSNWQEKFAKALKWKPDIIAISLNSFTLDKAIEIIQYCRKRIGQKAIFIAGGPHITLFQKDFMEQYRGFFDFAVVGEGEETIVDLLRHLRRPKVVKGIIYYDTRQHTLVQTERRPLINNLDSLPFPDFSVFDSVDVKKGLFNYQMISSRGCPYQCAFCTSDQIWTRKWRARSPENILKEIKFAVKKYHPRSLTFWDDNFTLDLNRAKKICDLLVTEKIGLGYSLAGVRADRVDEELISKLKSSGCLGISMGIEDGDFETFPFVRKGETLEQIAKTVKLIKRYQIPLLAYMVVGLINSSYKSFLRSLKFIEKLDITAHWSIAFPFPGTLLSDWVQQNGRFLMALEKGFKHSMTSKNPPVVFDTPAYPKEERLKAYYLGNLRTKSYDMLASSRGGNIFQQAFDVLWAIWQYDRKKAWWHFKNLFEIMLKW